MHQGVAHDVVHGPVGRQLVVPDELIDEHLHMLGQLQLDRLGVVVRVGRRAVEAVQRVAAVVEPEVLVAQLPHIRSGGEPQRVALLAHVVDHWSSLL